MAYLSEGFDDYEMTIEIKFKHYAVGAVYTFLGTLTVLARL